MAHYIPRPYRGRIVIFMAEESGGWRFGKDRLKWRELARGGSVVHVIPGTHERMLHEPSVALVAERLRSYVTAP
jgi:thioesterase domain-containing protein